MERREKESRCACERGKEGERECVKEGDRERASERERDRQSEI